MFSRIRKHFTYANVVMTLALVFVMSGGAYAAGKYLITSTKQISPKVLKSLKGANGIVGAAGPQGSAGPAGPGGPGGAKGENGANGANGKEGKKGEKGEEGKEGKEGSPWTAKGVLPSDSTETGTWVERSTANKAGEIRMTAISFPIQLAEPPAETIMGIGKPPTEGCEGTVTEPKALPGNLCIFEGESIRYKGHLKVIASTNLSGGLGPGKTGTELILGTGEPTTPGEEVSAEGTWAVTAK